MSERKPGPKGTNIHIQAGQVRLMIDPFTSEISSSGVINEHTVDITHKFTAQSDLIQAHAREEIMGDRTHTPNDGERLAKLLAERMSGKHIETTRAEDFTERSLTLGEVKTVFQKRLDALGFKQATVDVKQRGANWLVEIVHSHKLDDLPARTKSKFQAVIDNAHDKPASRNALKELNHNELNFKLSETLNHGAPSDSDELEL